MIMNLIIVWFLTGIWHGANWTYLIWGMMYGWLIVIEKTAGIPKRLEKQLVSIQVLYRFFTLLMVLFGWVLFRAESLSGAKTYFAAMFGVRGNSLIADDFRFYSREYIVYIIAGIVGSVPLLRKISGKLKGIKTVGMIVNATSDVCQLIMFILSISMLIMKAHNPFIYFNF